MITINILNSVGEPTDTITVSRETSLTHAISDLIRFGGERGGRAWTDVYDFRGDAAQLTVWLEIDGREITIEDRVQFSDPDGDDWETDLLVYEQNELYYVVKNTLAEMGVI